MDHNRHDQKRCASNRTLAVIPARTASTRLPRKLLLRETGKSILQHTYESACSAKFADEVIIAAADSEIAKEAARFGADVVMTDPNLPSGTDRVAEVARLREDADLLINVQGDEPELSPSSIDTAVRLLHDDPATDMATLATPIRNLAELDDPSCVKVVFDSSGKALYFSRSAIPHIREGVQDCHFHHDSPLFFKHIGLYAYRRPLLLELAGLPVSALEQAEKLEQLRVLASGHSIRVAVVDHASDGIDTADDYRKFVTRMSA